MPVVIDGGRHQLHMRRCLEAVRAEIAVSTYPLAAAVVREDEVLALETSRLPASHDPTAHPEVCAIRAAAAAAGSRYLPGAVLYSTVEPCPMCASAAIWARMSGIVFGVSQADVVAFAEENGTATLTWRQIRIEAAAVAAAGEPTLWVVGSVMRQECLDLLRLTLGRSTAGSEGGADASRSP